LAIDETSFQKRHEYVTVILDMWDPFIAALKEQVPDAEKKLCFDRYHVAQHFGKAVDKVRNEEQRKLLREDGASPLTGTRYEWLKNSGLIDNRSRRDFFALCRSELKTARAWAIKETASRLWGYEYLGVAEKMRRRLLNWISHCRLEPVKKVGRMIRYYLWGILNAIAFHAGNAMAEAKNACIQRIKRMACGFRNRTRFKNAILFHLGGLNLLPKGTFSGCYPH
jgi:transposase